MNNCFCDDLCCMAEGWVSDNDSPKIHIQIGNTQLSSSSCANLNGTWKSMNDKEKLEFIKRDCLSRIDDVKKTNSIPTYSAFLSIPATIGYFSNLAFSYSSALKTAGTTDKDKKKFMAFCDKYMLHLPFVGNQRSAVSKVLYTLRCGLIHGASLKCLTGQKKTSGNNQDWLCTINVCITQSKDNGKTLQEIDSLLATAWSNPSETVEFTLHADALCDALSDAVDAMCNDTDPDVPSSIIRVFEEEPHILCAKL